MKKFLAVFFMLSIVLMCESVVNAEDQTYAMPTGSITDKLQYLSEIFEEGLYWNHWSESQLGSADQWKVSIGSFTTTLSTKPCNHSNSKNSCNHYWGTQGGSQCCGYARMIYNLIWNADPIATAYSMRYIVSTDDASMLYYVSVGDIIWTGSHYLVVTGKSGNTIYGTDCNSLYKCNIKWSRTWTIETLAQTMKKNGKGAIFSPSQTIINDNSCDWQPYRIVYSGGQRIRRQPDTDSAAVTTVAADKIVYVDMNRTVKFTDYGTWGYARSGNGEYGWIRIDNSSYCVKISFPDFTVIDTTTQVAKSTKTKTNNPGDDQCYVKAGPYEDETTIRVEDKDTSIILIGSVQNGYGNVWYITEDGYYIWEGDLTFVDVEEPEFEYLLKENGTIEITGYSGSESDLTIPSEIDGYQVTDIGAYAFEDCASLTSVTIPDSMTSIGEGAFALCNNLTSITIPNSVTSIGSRAFTFCTSLASITIPGSVTSIGYNAFSYCDSLMSVTIQEGVTSIEMEAFQNCSSLTNITIPDSVTSIGESAFDNCISLNSVTIPDSVTSIGNAFSNCSSLTSVTIPASVTYIGDYAFDYCSSLTSINVSAGNPAYASVGGVLFDKAVEVLLCCPGGYSGEYAIPAGVTSIGESAFDDCISLTSVTIPSSVTSIGKQAFAGCSSLTNVTIPDSVTSIGYCAFYGCDNLVSVTIPDSVTSIGGSAFQSCESLTSITIPSSVTSIGKYAFLTSYNDLVVWVYRDSYAHAYCKESIDNAGSYLHYRFIDEEDPTVQRTPGDATGDSVIDWSDVILTLKHVMGLGVSANLSNADVTGDGLVDWSDIILTLKHVMGLSVELK